MKNYELEKRKVFDTTYLSIALGNLDLIPIVKRELELLECVRKVNITRPISTMEVRKPEDSSECAGTHLTVYIHDFFDFDESMQKVEMFLDKLDERNLEEQIKEKIEPKEAEHSSIQVSLEEKLNEIVPVRKPAPNAIDGTAQPAPKIRHTKLGDIPEGTKVVFISYAQEDGVNEWVKKLAGKLRTDHGLYTILDQDQPYGLDLPTFMTEGIRLADKVIVIGTPLYKRKADALDASGTQFENSIINTELFQGAKNKFIPVLRKGSFKESFTEIMGVKGGADYSNGYSDYDLAVLASNIWGEPINQAPPLGKKPDYSIYKKKVATNAPSAPIVANAQQNVDPYKGEEWLKRFLLNFSFNLMDEYFQDMPQKVYYGVVVSFRACDNLYLGFEDDGLSNVIMDFLKLWKKITVFGNQFFVNSDNPKYFCLTTEADDILNIRRTSKKYLAIWRNWHKALDSYLMGLEKDLPELQKRYNAMKDYIKRNYPDIDLEETSKHFENSLTI